MRPTIECRSIRTARLSRLPFCLACLVWHTGEVLEFDRKNRRLVGCLWFNRFFVFADFPKAKMISGDRPIFPIVGQSSSRD